MRKLNPNKHNFINNFIVKSFSKQTIKNVLFLSWLLKALLKNIIFYFNGYAMIGQEVKKRCHFLIIFLKPHNALSSAQTSNLWCLAPIIFNAHVFNNPLDLTTFSNHCFLLFILSTFYYKLFVYSQIFPFLQRIISLNKNLWSNKSLIFIKNSIF